MSVSITCYDGVLSIGGNKILLEDEERETRLFFDFGLPFARRYLFFEEYLKPRPGVGLRDPLRLGLLPPLEGIYRTDLLAALSAEDRAYISASPHHRRLDIDGVFLSHAHLDHSGYISFLREDIPIYTTAMTAFIAKVVQDTGQPDFEREVCYLNLREPNEKGVLCASRQKNYLGRPYVLVDNPALVKHDYWRWSPAQRKDLEISSLQASPERIGGFPLKVYPVDHSIYGASACAVESSVGWVIYTGDLRLRGIRGRLSRQFIESAAALQPVAMLCEGTRIDNEGPEVTEEQVFDAALRVAQGAQGVILADFAARNIDRLLVFLRVAKEIGRRLAISPGDGFLLEKMRHVDASLPDVAGEEAVVIYADVKSAPRYWERELRERYEAKGKLIGARQVRGSPEDYILCFSFYDINDLVDIDPQRGTYIYSSSEAYNEESVLDLWRLRNWLGTFEVEFIGDPDRKEEHRELHASGHASGADLLSMIKQIHPQVLIPIHTEKPELFAKGLTGTGIKVCLPQKGKPIRLP